MSTTEVEMAATPAPVHRLNHPRHWPFRLKLALLALALGLIPAAVVTIILAWQADHQGQDRQDQALSIRARTAAAYVGTILDTEVQSLQGLAASDPARKLVSDPGSTADNRRFQQFLLAPLLGAATTAPSLAGGAVYITAAGGTILASSNPTLLESAAGGVPAVQRAVAGKAPAAVLGPALGATGPALVVAVPIMRGAGAAGAVVGQFDPASLYAALDTAGASLVLADGRTVSAHIVPAGGPAQLLGTPLAVSPAGQVPALAALSDGRPLALADGSWAGPVPGADAVVVVSPVMAAQPLLASGATPAILVVIAILTMLAAAVLSLLLAAPLTTLARSLVAVRGGNFNMRVCLPQRDEVGQIAGTVDMLIARTQALVTDLDNQRLELENGIIQLFTELAEAASGDLTVRPTMSEGSLGAVADSVGILLERFNATVKRIQATAGAVSAGTSQMAATVLRVSHEAQKQASQLATGAAAITEMATSAQAVSQRTLAATDVAAQAVAAVESGNKAVTYSREAVKRTTETSRKAARQVKSLGESTQLMGNALLLVQRNTEELHLIAGNASIEAARYAENGGVFRTVADSIEQLAQQSQVALRQIQSVVENTQRETSRVVSAIEEVTTEVVNVAKAVSLAGENFDTINHVVQRLADLNVFIASASEQQAQMAADVAEMIGTLNQVSVQTSMNTAASAEAAVRLRQLTEQLNDSVSTLKVS